MASKRKKNAAPRTAPQEQEAPEIPHEPYRDPYSKEPLLSPDEQEAVLEHLVIQQKEQELIAAGWETTSDAAEETGLSQLAINQRVRKLAPDTRYDFTEVLTREIVSKKGALWVWRIPNRQNAEHLIHPDLIEIYRQEVEKEKQLREQQWKTIAEAAEETDLKEDAIRVRVRKIDPDKDRCFIEALTGKSVTKKGAEWVYRNPNLRFPKNNLISPSLVEIWRQEVKKEKQLEKQGWETTAKIAEETGLNRKALGKRARKIMSEEECSLQEPLTGNTITRKGSEWAYKNLNLAAAETFIHPDLAKILQQETEKEKQLKEQGWKTAPEATKETGLKESMIRKRLKKIDPDEDCSLVEVLTGRTITKKGSKWTYKNPNLKSPEVLTHPDFIKILQQEVEKERQLKEQGWKTTAEVARETELKNGTIKTRIRTLDSEKDHSFREPSTGNIITKKGSEWRYKNPNSQSAEYFIHPDFVRILQQEAEMKAGKTTKKGAKAQKIGTLDEEKSPGVADEAARKKKGRGHGK